MIKQSTANDPQLQTVLSFIRSGWPEYIGKVPESVRDFHQVTGELSELDGLVIRGSRIVIPAGVREMILERIHDGRQGLVKCRERAFQSVWWPKMRHDITTKVQQCPYCRENKNTQTKEPLIPSELPSRPWQKVAIDLCEFKKQNYLIVSDYFLRFLEILNLSATTSSQVISRLKATFACYGIPEVSVSDNGPQLASAEMREFSKDYSFTHVMSSPHFLQSNGHAERAVQIIKGILRQEDPLLALMTYRATPSSSTVSQSSWTANGQETQNLAHFAGQSENELAWHGHNSAGWCHSHAEVSTLLQLPKRSEESDTTEPRGHCIHKTEWTKTMDNASCSLGHLLHSQILHSGDSPRRVLQKEQAPSVGHTQHAHIKQQGSQPGPSSRRYGHWGDPGDRDTGHCHSRDSHTGNYDHSLWQSE